MDWQLERAEDRARWWVREDLYTVEPRTPLSASVFNEMWDEDALWISEEMSVADSRGFNVRTVNGYTYLGPIAVTDPEEIERRRSRAQPIIQNLLESFAADLDRYRATQRATLERWDDPELDPQRPMALLGRWREALSDLQAFYRLHFRIVFPRHAATGMLEGLARGAGIESAGDIGKLTQAMGTTRQLQLDIDLWHLADEALALELAPIFKEHAAAQLPAVLQGSDAGASWWAAFEAFLDLYGRRLTAPKELSSPTWKENPTTVLETVRTYIERGGGFDFDALRDARARERDEVRRAAAQSIDDSSARQRFTALADQAQSLQAAMEDDNFYCLSMAGHVRRVALAAGAALCARGAFGSADDVFYLTKDELGRALVDAASHTYRLDDLTDLVQTRRRQRADQLAADPPAYLGDPPATIEHFLLNRFWGVTDVRSPQAEGSTIAGIGVTDGVTEGIARVALTLDDLGELGADDILVTISTNPAWTFVFSKISGVVTDQGGTLSHAAVVAREYGIPAVLGTRDATKRIRSGQRVRIDGKNGKVEILDR